MPPTDLLYLPDILAMTIASRAEIALAVEETIISQIDPNDIYAHRARPMLDYLGIHLEQAQADANVEGDFA